MPEPQDTLAARRARFDDAIALRRPGRVPVLARFGGFIADLEGATKQALYQDPELAQRALEHALVRFQPDSGSGLWHTPGPSVALGDRSTRWPGHGAGPGESFQYVEQEFMTAADYDAFLADPSDWAVRSYLPRVFSALEGLRMLPPLAFAAFGYYALFQHVHLFAQPALVAALESLARAARLQMDWIAAQIDSARRCEALGFPAVPLLRGPLLAAPFDFMADTLRGMRGVFLDMRRCPDLLLAAEERVIGFQVETALAISRARNNYFAFLPLHRGSDGFIGLPAFQRFYWPQLKALLLRLIEVGITPVVFYEGAWDQRLPFLAELPPGKTIGYFQQTDIFRAKQVLGEIMCIMGGMPVNLLSSGTPEEVRGHTRKVCDEVGSGGGLIMTTDIGDLQGCRPELVQAWIDAARSR